MAQLQRSSFGCKHTDSTACTRNRVRTVAVRAAQHTKGDGVSEDTKLGAAFLAAAVTASMLVGADMIAPGEAAAASSGGRAGASKFSSRRKISK